MKSTFLRKPAVGTLEFYNGVFQNVNDTYIEHGATNVVRICPRNRSQGNKQVNLTKITTKDVICWYSRKFDGERFPTHPNIKHEKRPGFNHRRPEAYQVSRVQVKDRYKFENTRQAMCMFCQVPHFYCLFRTSGLLFHMHHAHRHELPQFVRRLFLLLDLFPERQPHSSCDTNWARIRKVERFTWPGFVYLDDGVSNRLRFAPRPGIEKTKMKLADVSEEVLIYWYQRDLPDFQKYDHPSLTYKLNPNFDPHRPSVFQLARCPKDENGCERKNYTQLACMYCQEPHFRFMHGLGGLLSHISAYHWPMVTVSVEEVREADKIAD